MDYPSGEFGSAVPAVLPPSLFSTPTLPEGWEQNKKALTLCKSCWTTAHYQYCFQSDIQNTAPDRLLRGKLSPYQPYPVHDFMLQKEHRGNVQRPYLHFNDCLQSLRLCWLRLKLGSSMQFLWRDTIEISLTTHLSIISITHMN